MSSSAVKKYYAFTPYKKGEATYGLERLADIEAEVRVLHDEHYQETETTYLDTEFSPSYDRYKASEEIGQFVLFTVRIGSTLAGYLQYYVFNDMHTQMKQAREDAFFISKPFRGKKLASDFLAYAESALQGLSCTMVGMTSKHPIGAPDITDFLESRGYNPTAVFFTKKLEG